MRKYPVRWVKALLGEPERELADLELPDVADVMGRSVSTVRDYCSSAARACTGRRGVSPVSDPRVLRQQEGRHERSISARSRASTDSRSRLSDDRSEFVRGHCGEMYEYGSVYFAVMLLDLTAREWGYRKRTGKRHGMTVMQNGDREGTMTFDPTDRGQADLAIKFAGVRRKKRITPEYRKRLSDMGRATRFKSRGRGEGRGFGGAQGSSEVWDG